MKITDDLRDAKWMFLKAFLFGVIGVFSVVGILLEHPNWREALLLALAIWSFCRLYYFAFYVIEKYIDAKFRFAGIGSVLHYLLRRKK